MSRCMARSYLLSLGIALLVFLVSSCGDSSDTTGPSQGSGALVYRSDMERDPAPDISDLEGLVRGNHELALDLYHALTEEEEGNYLISPLSIRMAFGMVYGGARGETQEQIAEVLRFMLAQDDLHTAFNALDLALQERNLPAGNAWGEEQGPVELYVANRFWGRIEYPFIDEYLDLLARNYGCGVHAVDFLHAWEKARETINLWVENQTRERIKDLLPPGSVDSQTVAVLTNAVYLKAPWAVPFAEFLTADGPFYLLDGGEVTVPMMQQDEWHPYYEDADCQAVELPCRGEELAMVIILPSPGQFTRFETDLDVERLGEILTCLEANREVLLTLPKFSFGSGFSLKKTLHRMGMTVPFERFGADFGGMVDLSRLPPGYNVYISDAFHKTFVGVDEKGVEAAAATAVVMGEATSISPTVALRVDRPFLFLIRDRGTGAILFVGRVLDPTA
jgi:serpin B